MIGIPPTTTSSSSVDNSRMSFSFSKFKNSQRPQSFAVQPPTACNHIKGGFHADWQEKNPKIMQDRVNAQLFSKWHTQKLQGKLGFWQFSKFLLTISMRYNYPSGEEIRIVRSLASKKAGRWATIIQVIGRSLMILTIALSVSTSRFAVPSSRNKTLGSW